MQIHPNQENCAALDRLDRYYLSNLFGNPIDTTIAAASLIFGGVMEQLPLLNVCLVHGGGTLPYVLGQLLHGYTNIQAARTISKTPAHLFSLLLLRYSRPRSISLRFLRELVGSERLLLGAIIPTTTQGNRIPLVSSIPADLEKAKMSLGKPRPNFWGS